MTRLKAARKKGSSEDGNQPRKCKSSLFFFLVMVGVATWRLEIRLEPGFFFLLNTKGGRDQGRDRLERQKYGKRGGDRGR